MIGVEDNGNGLKDIDINEMKKLLDGGQNENEEITGIKNIHKRIKLTLGNNSGVRIMRGKLGGLRVEIHLEMRGMSDV